MGFREPIDLSGFIRSSPELTEVLGGGEPHFTLSPPSSVLFIPQAVDYGEVVLYETPALGCSGVPYRSTCTELEPWPSIVWDVNGYYHALGVGFRASRRQLAEGYRVNGGPDDARLTYYFQQLLDSEVRRAYDAMPLGSTFMDRYVEDAIRIKAHEMSARLRESGMDISPEDILLDMGFVPKEELPNESGEVDTSSEDEQTEGAVEEREQDADPEPWPYAYYLWSVKAKDSRDHDIEHMARWQDLIAQECTRKGLRIAFAVGLMGAQREGSRVATMSVGGVTVAFIEQSAVDQMDELARLVVQRLIN